MKYIIITVSTLATLIMCGCSSIIDARKQKAELIILYNSGQLKAASTIINEKAVDRRDTGDQLMWDLEAGTIDFDAGKYETSLENLSRAEKKIEAYNNRADISARDIGAETGSAFTNLNALPYKGFCYDRILLNVYKAFDYFALGKPSGAMVELRRMRYTQEMVYKQFQTQIDEQQKAIEKNRSEIHNNVRKAKTSKRNAGMMSYDQIKQSKEIKATLKAVNEKSEKAYGNFMNPFATYMSALGYLYEQNYGEAMVDFRNLYRMNKNNRLTNRDFVTVANALGSPMPASIANVKPYDYSLKSDIVYVIFANGRGPALKQEKFWLVLPWVGYTGLAFPRYEYFKTAFKGVKIVAGKREAETVVVANMDNIVSQEYKKRLPAMVTRIVISYLTKESASLVATRAAAQANVWVEVAAYVGTGIYKYMFNTADTRCWETIPKEYQIAHIPIPEDRKLTLCTTPHQSSAKPFKIKLKKSTSFAIIYIRGIDSKVLTHKVFEFDQKD